MNKSESGSFTLQTIFSTMGGLAFIMLFMNLTHYITATNALHQATQAVMRCLTPTDPLCASYSAPSSSVPLDWFGYDPSLITQKQEFTIDRYDYSAKMVRDVWSGSYDTYEIRQMNPVVSSPILRARVFEVPLNRYITNPEVTTDIKKAIRETETLTYVVPFANGSGAIFPAFDRDEEELSKNEAASRYWDASGSLTKYQFQFSELPFTDSTLRINSGDAGRFETAWTKVPELVENLGCLPGSTPSCDSIYSQVSRDRRAAASHSWQSHARLAIKAFSNVSAVRGDPSVKWGLLPVGEGLILQYSSSETGPVEGHYDLGGRNTEAVNDSRPFHLVLRGSSGSHGAGSDPSPPEDAYHEDLHVERGKFFRIVARFSASSGDIQVTPRVFYYLDSYQPAPKSNYTDLTVDCTGSAPLKPDGSIDQAHCPPESQCPFEKKADRYGVKYSYTDLHCFKTLPLVAGTPTCEESDQTYEPPYLEQSLFFAFCDPTRSPTTEDVEIPADRISCGDPAPVSNEISVSTTSVCSGPHPDVLPFTCSNLETFREDGNYGTATSCAGLDTKLSELNAAISTVRDEYKKLIGQLTDLSMASFSSAGAVESSPASWTKSWTPTDGAGAVIRDTSKLVTDAVEVQTKPNVYERKDKSWKPSISHYDFPSVDGLGTPPLIEVAKTFQVKNRLGSEDVEITEPKTFREKPTPQIYWGQDIEADFDRDCTWERECKAAFDRSASEEEALRKLAAEQIPEARDMSLTFSYLPPIKRDTVPISALEAPNLSACTPVRPECQSEVKPEALVSLGQFPSLTRRPSVCEGEDPRYLACFSRLPEGTTLPSDAPVRENKVELALKAGNDELKRLLPHARFACSESSCAVVDLDTATDTNSARVQVSYNMPLSTPLNSILGTDFITLRQSSSESWEIAR